MATRRGSLCLLTLLSVASLKAADPPLEPVTVCEVLKDASQYDGKAVAVMGRFSSRQTGRSLNEESCGEGVSARVLSLSNDSISAPKPPLILEIDSAVLSKKLKSIKQNTALREFRFGTPDYDRWAIIYGRIEVPKPSASDDKVKREPAAVRLLYRGDGVVYFLRDDE